MTYDDSADWGPAPGRRIFARGPREAERVVLEAIASDQAQLAANPVLLEAPLRVVVPSQSLRQHLAGQLVEKRSHAVAGVAIQTLHGLALEVLEGRDESVRVAAPLLPVLCREAARAEPVLRESLEDLVDGYAAVRAAVDDLLDAGFEGHHADAVEERIADLATRGASREIADAIVRVALRVQKTLEANGYAHRSALMRRAQEIVEADPGALGARGILVYGFSDATGVATEFLRSLLARPGSLAVLDRPPEPGSSGNTEEVDAFSERFGERLAASGHLEEVAAATRFESPELACFEALGGEAEVREVGVRIQALVQKGVLPEAIGVVARDLSAYALAIRSQFTRLAIPFSGVGQAVAAAPGRYRVAALMELLRSGGECLADRWLDSVGGQSEGGGHAEFGVIADLRLALRSIGATRLAHVAALGPQAADLRLPVPAGLDPLESGPSGGPSRRDSRGLHRSFSGAALGRASESAQRLLDALLEWPRRQEVSAHAGSLEELVLHSLGWGIGEPETHSWFEGIRDALDSLPADFVIDREDFVAILDRIAQSAGEIPLGGRGGGVQVLSVMEARARTFSHLFVLGLNRDVFPRPVREDPILDDGVRRAIGELLPDMPVKRRGHDEDRHLFAQLVASAPNVTLSWQSASDDGKAAARSTFIERLLWQEGGVCVERIAPFLSAPAESHARAPLTRPVFELALEASLEPRPEALRDAISAAITESRNRADLPVLTSGAADAIADARLSTVAELDRSFGAPDLGPYFGFVGEATLPGDRRRGPCWVTALEALARCPWQAFLSRVLRVESVSDRVAEIPDLESHVLGNVVHGALERIFRETATHDDSELALVAEREPVSVPWPDPKNLERVLLQSAHAALARAGLRFSGMASVAAERARPFVEAARERVFADAEFGLAAESAGEVARHADGPQSDRIFFTADRVDRNDGDLLLTDYKTGKPLCAKAKAEDRREELLAAVRSGKALQAAAYALCRDRDGDAGRYVFLGPDIPPHSVSVTVRGGDGEVIEAFEETVSRLLGLRRKGGFVPRLISPKGGGEADVCRTCDLAQACLRGDSGARGRLGRWFEAAGEPGDEVGTREALRRLFDPKGAGRWTAAGSPSRAKGKR